MRGLLGSIIGKLAASATGGVEPGLEKHFAALDKAERGLARKAASYITDGSGGAVLATLGTPAVTAIWRGQARSYPRTTPALRMLATPSSDAMLMRYGEVLAMLEPAPSNSHWGAFGTKTSPDWIRHAFSSDLDRRRTEPLCTVDRLAHVAALGDASPSAVLDIVFHPGPGVAYGTQHSVERFAGVAEWLGAHVAVVTEAQAKLDASGRMELAHAIGRMKLVARYLPLLIDYGVSTAKTVRGAAMKALTAAPHDTLSAALADRYASAAPGVRAELVTLAVGTLGVDAHALLRGWRETETDKRPGEALDRALANVALSEAPKAAIGPWERGYAALDGSTVNLPPRRALPAASRIPDAVYALLQPSIDSYNAHIQSLREQNRHEKHHWSRSHALIGRNDLAAFRQAAESHGAIVAKYNNGGLRPLQWANSYVKWDHAGIAEFYGHPAVTLRHLIAILRYDMNWNFLAILGDSFGHNAAQEIQRRLKSQEDFQIAADLWVELGGKPPAVEYLQVAWQASLGNADPELLWPVIAESFDAIDEALGLRPQSHQPPVHPGNALDLLGILPKVPHRYMLALMTIATGTQKSMRQHARNLLGGAPDIDAAIEALLGDGKQDTRAGAADWLAARGTRAALQGLRKALKTEKSDVARAAIITAREKLGDDVSDCFDPKSLLAEAEFGLAKTSTKGIEWFPFDLLPGLSWQDGKPVDPRIVRWWVVLANKLKQPGSNALLDLWLARLKPDDARRLSLFVLRSWIEQDTKMPSDDEGNAYALSQIDATLKQNRQAVQRNPNYAEYYITDRDKLFAMLKRSKTSQYLGSASDSKGVLALGTQAEGADAASSVRAYLKDHGSRVSQAKALLDVLAANPAPSAIQVVLATANRFKARTVQEHAVSLIERIAERRGWTPEELADRTIPSAGLDERGEADLDCGTGRTYRLALDVQDALVLLNAAGQPTKALPTPRNDDEKPLIVAAKKQVATARKELKQAIAAQTERLYDAMCLERRWSVEDWQTHLLQHPIVGRLLRRIVWIGLDGEGNRVSLFRPLDDGSLSDVSDGEVSLDSLAQVQIAHASLISADEAQAWRTHLEDYEVGALFAQLDRDLPKLSDNAAGDTSIEDRKGWMIETFKLRGTATKLGFIRGAAEDGGVFMTYERRFEAAKLVALIEFTGSPLPEQNIPGALQELRFVKLRRGGGWHGTGVPLKDVPPVLLAESWKTLHSIAAAGTGFDPAWEKKAGW